MGGGGDVVGALGVAEQIRTAGGRAPVGGVTWERRPIDPLPGPRRLAEVAGGEPLGPDVLLADGDTRGPGGFRFAESHMARHLGEPVVLLDVNPGPAAIAAALRTACDHLDCDAVALVDVGGDVLGHGHETGLASPLCDAVVLAAAPALVDAGLEAFLAVFGPGCDGELSVAEVLERIAEVARAGGWLDAWGLTPRVADRLEAAVAQVPTEASAQAVACARGSFGRAEIRGGRRSVERSPVGALTFLLDPAVTMASAGRLAAALDPAGTLQDAQTALNALGVRTELDYEEDAAAGA